MFFTKIFCRLATALGMATISINCFGQNISLLISVILAPAVTHETAPPAAGATTSIILSTARPDILFNLTV